MASLISLKKEVEVKSGTSIQMTFSGANEAHLLAKEIGDAGIGVILQPSRPFPGAWKSRRMLGDLNSSDFIAVSNAFLLVCQGHR